MKTALLITVGISALGLTPLRADDKVDFAKSVRPILEKTCLECHGAAKDKGDLRLHTKAAALAHVIVPGKPEESELFKRVSLPKDHDDVMPPKGDPLTPEQVAVLKAWIAQGADWPEGVVLGDSAGPAKKDEFASLKAPADTAAEKAAIEKLSTLGVGVRPIAQNMPWTTAMVRPQDEKNLPQIMEQLKAVGSLVELNLASQKIGDGDLAHIAGLSNLLRLHLEKTPVTDAGLPHLKGLVNLRYLNLYNTAVTDDGLANLSGLASLERLYLWQTKVTDAGAAKLKEAVATVTINRGEELVVAKVEEKKEEKPEEKK